MQGNSLLSLCKTMEATGNQVKKVAPGRGGGGGGESKKGGNAAGPSEDKV